MHVCAEPLLLLFTKPVDVVSVGGYRGGGRGRSENSFSKLLRAFYIRLKQVF
jgi:hypothetical protein